MLTNYSLNFVLCLVQAREYWTLFKEDARTRPTMSFLPSLFVSYEMLSSVSFFFICLKATEQMSIKFDVLIIS